MTKVRTIHLDEYLSLKEAAAVLRVKETTLRTWAQRRKISHHRLNDGLGQRKGPTLFSKRDLAMFLEACKKDAI